MRKGVSIIICTFNGATRLVNTIRHLAVQKTDNLDWEIIFVDNASTDDSTNVVLSVWDKFGPSSVQLTTLRVETPGKIFALEEAFSRAQFEYAIICDDDNWLSPNYTQLVYEILESNPHIGAVGGQSNAITDSGNLPEWFDQYKDGYAVGQQGDKTGDVTARGHLWGAGMGTRTVLYIKMYEHFPSFLTGRKGNALTAGEDAEYCQRLILRGYMICYDSRLIFSHYMPNSRLTIEYRDRLFKGFGDSNTILDNYYIASKYITKYRAYPVKRLKYFAVYFYRLLFASQKKRDEASKALVFAGILPANSSSVILKIKNFYKKGSRFNLSP